MKKQLAVILLVLCFAMPTFAQWVQTTGTSGIYINSFAVSGTNLFVGTHGSGIFLSTNNGTSWTAVNSGLTSNYVNALAINGTNIFAGTWDGGIFLSTNNGTSWTAVNTGLTMTYVHALAVSGTNIFAGTNNGGVFLSTNNGTGWTAVNSGLTAPSLTVFSFTVSSNNIFAGTGDGGVFLSTNNGTNWSAINSGLTINEVHALTVSGSNIFAGTSGGGIFLSTNNGTSWTPVNSGLTNTYVYALAVSTSNLFAGAYSSSVFLSTNNGTGWTNVSSGFTGTLDMNALIVSDTYLLVGTSNGVWRRPLSEMTASSSPSISVTSPNGGETWQVGSSHNITWTSSNITNVNILNSTNNGSVWNGIAISYSASGGSYNWTVPSAPSTQCKVRVEDATNPTAVFDVSDSTFTISSTGTPTITVTSPNGGETWQVGSSHNITWTNNNVANVMIDYSTNGGSSWNGIEVTTPAASGSYTWTIPNTPSDQCKVRVSDFANLTTVTDQSDNVFTISSSSGGTGLIAYYPFNGNTNDESGNGRNGVNYGATPTTDRFGQPDKAYSFNGTSNYINIPGTGNLHLTSGFTLCAWVNFTEALAVKAIVSKHISGYGNGYILQIRTGTAPEFFVSSEPGLVASESINDGRWHFLVGTYDGSTMKLYVDNVLKLNQSKTYSSTNDSTIMIGKHHEGVASDWFNGKIDDIRIYDKPLTVSEISQLYNEGLGLSSGLVAYYPFNGNANEVSGNGKNGVNYGAILTTDRFGNPNSAYSFDGISNYIDIPGTNAIHLTSGLALCAWINFTDALSLHEIVGKHISGYGNGYYIMIRPATSPEFYISSEPGLESSDVLNDGRWHFIVGNYDGVTQKLYVDGNLKSSQAKTYSTTNDSTIMIGKQHVGAAANWFSGKIDDIRIYNRPLSEMEISALLNEGPVEVKEPAREVPSMFRLEQNYPNPFNPSTTIRYGLPLRSTVRLAIYNILGQVVKELVNTELQAGYQIVVWNANVSSGLYFYRIEATSVEDPNKHFIETKKMILMK